MCYQKYAKKDEACISNNGYNLLCRTPSFVTVHKYWRLTLSHTTVSIINENIYSRLVRLVRYVSMSKVAFLELKKVLHMYKNGCCYYLTVILKNVIVIQKKRYKNVL